MLLLVAVQNYKVRVASSCIPLIAKFVKVIWFVCWEWTHRHAVDAFFSLRQESRLETVTESSKHFIDTFSAPNYIVTQPWIISDTGWFWNNIIKFNLLLMLWKYAPLFRTFNDDAFAQWLCAQWVGYVDDMIAVDTGLCYRSCARRKTVHRGGMNEWMDEWMNEWMDEWVDGWMSGWMD